MRGPDLEARLRQALSRAEGASSDFDLNRDVIPPEARLTPAAVLVGVRAARESVVLTTRSARLKHHPGQVAFPGGKQDPGDADAVACALREAEEEIGLAPDGVRVLGCLPPHRTVTGFSVTPVLALIDSDEAHRAEEGEVAEVFEVPLAHLADPRNYRIEGRHWRGQRRRYYVVPYGPYYIWGATARMLRGLAEALQ